MAAPDARRARRRVGRCLVASLKNEHIVHVNDLFEHDGVPYISMEYLERDSLCSDVGHLSLTARCNSAASARAHHPSSSSRTEKP